MKTVIYFAFCAALGSVGGFLFHNQAPYITREEQDYRAGHRAGYVRLRGPGHPWWKCCRVAGEAQSACDPGYGMYPHLKHLQRSCAVIAEEWKRRPRFYPHFHMTKI